MKVRNGFVSNSSSSSFCIYGVQLEGPELLRRMSNGDMQAIYDCLNAELDHLDEPITDQESFDNLVDEWGIGEVIYNLTKKVPNNLEVHTGSEYDEDVVSIGREWCHIGDKETGEQFKKSIEEAIEKFLGPGLQCGTIEEAFRC